MLIENTRQSLEYIRDLIDIEVSHIIESPHSTHILIQANKQEYKKQIELIVYANAKEIKSYENKPENWSSDDEIIPVEKDKFSIQDKVLKIIDKNGKNHEIEFFLGVLKNYVIHLNHD